MRMGGLSRKGEQVRVMAYGCLGPKLPKLPHQACTMPLAVARRDVGPSAAFLRRAIWLYLGDALQNKVPMEKSVPQGDPRRILKPSLRHNGLTAYYET